MAAYLDGTAIDLSAERKSTADRPVLYLPPDLCVDAVHLSEELHEAIYVVQTESATAYCLKHTGQTIGTVDDGISERIMQLLQCTSKGRHALS